MNTSIVKIHHSSALPVISKRVQYFVNADMADNSRKAYEIAWIDFTTYCSDRNIQPAPASPNDLAEYLVFCADGGLRVSTIKLRIASISKYHSINNLPDPTKNGIIKSVMGGIKRKMYVRPNQKKPLSRAGLTRIVAGMPDNLTGVRNKAIILIHWAGGFRRGELLDLNINDLEFIDSGVKILIRKSKTDQSGHGFVKTIPFIKETDVCPVLALRNWIEKSGITDGPVFRKIDRWGKVGTKRLWSRIEADIIKRGVSSIGLDPKKYSGHSPRTGFVTESVERGVDGLSIAAVTGQTLQTIAKYQRSAGVVAQQAIKKAFGE